jgi:symplekin
VQCIHWHIPTLVRNLGSSCPEMLDIIHNPPEGSEELVTMVLQFILSSGLLFVLYCEM